MKRPGRLSSFLRISYRLSLPVHRQRSNSRIIRRLFCLATLDSCMISPNGQIIGFCGCPTRHCRPIPGFFPVISVHALDRGANGIPKKPKGPHKRRITQDGEERRKREETGQGPLKVKPITTRKRATWQSRLHFKLLSPCGKDRLAN